jgi:class 3 adenylate cyclase
MTATRRLAAIIAVDVVGYSRLMSDDEAGTVLTVREYREAALATDHSRFRSANHGLSRNGR